MSTPTNQPRTILGPLTTTYTPPASCAVALQDCSTCSQAWQAQSCFASTSDGTTNYGDEDNTDCWPPRSSFGPTGFPPLSGWGFYSPGLVCPTGMTPACSATGGGSTGWPIQYGLLTQETAVGCCPSGFSCANGYAQTCIQTATSTSFQAVTCESGTTGGFTFLTIPVTVSTAAISQYTLFAPLIQINWQSSDLPTSTITSPSTSPSPSNTSSPTTTSAPSPGLSTGAKAGIGVAVALGALAILALAFFIYRKRRNAYAQARQDSPTITQRYELNAARKGPHVSRELPNERQVAELPPGEETRPGDGQVHEMNG